MKMCSSCLALYEDDVEFCAVCISVNFKNIGDGALKDDRQYATAESSIPQSRSREIQILTIDHVPGQEIDQAIDSVVGHGVAWFGTSNSRVVNARENAMADLRKRAIAMNADAVVGVSLSISGIRGFWGFSLLAQSAVVHVTGTAVLLKDK
jgi:uncharacterized protein YbjQ (UPF0145 family)